MGKARELDTVRRFHPGCFLGTKTSPGRRSKLTAYMTLRPRSQLKTVMRKLGQVLVPARKVASVIYQGNRRKVQEGRLSELKRVHRRIKARRNSQAWENASHLRSLLTVELLMANLPFETLIQTIAEDCGNSLDPSAVTVLQSASETYLMDIFGAEKYLFF